MPYDEDLAARVRHLMRAEPGLSEKRMFGGLGFLIDGNMAVAASSERDLMVRCDPDLGVELAGRPLASPMEMRGRVMTGWLRVGDPDLPGTGLDDEALEQWVSIGRDHARTLPPK